MKNTPPPTEQSRAYKIQEAKKKIRLGKGISHTEVKDGFSSLCSLAGANKQSSLYQNGKEIDEYIKKLRDEWD